MEGALETNQRRASGRIAGQLDGALDRLRPAVREENAVELAWGDGRDAFGKLDGRLVMRNDRRVDHLVELRFGRRDDRGMTVPQIGDADAGGEIEVAAAVDPVQVGA